MSLSSVKRYANKSDRGYSLTPKKSPGSASKLDQRAKQLLAEDLAERPYATLEGRCDYIEVMTGCSVSRSTMCRAIARVGSKGTTRKKQPCSESRAVS